MWVRMHKHVNHKLFAIAEKTLANGNDVIINVISRNTLPYTRPWVVTSEQKNRMAFLIIKNNQLNGKLHDQQNRGSEQDYKNVSQPSLHTI